MLLEARNRVGGRAWTLPGEFALDLGCGWLHSADENEWAALAPQLGFAVDDYPPPWARPAFEGNFSAAEQKEYWAAWRALLCARRRGGGRTATGRCRSASSRAGAGTPMLGAMVTYINGAEAEKIVAARIRALS